MHETNSSTQNLSWLSALRQEVRATNQTRAAERLGLSEATVSQVLSGSYAAATTRIQRRVEGSLMGACCNCPVMGTVTTRVCQDVQERQLPIANPQHAQAWHACRGRGPFSRAGACAHFNGAAKARATTDSNTLETPKEQTA
jgi:hypothetical protein